MTPDYERAAIVAAETLVKYGVEAAPVDPLPILKKIPGVLILSYEDISNDIGTDRNCILSMFGEHGKDAFTSVNVVDGKKQYIVTYNAKLSITLFQRALARELGHILLGHDGTLPEDVRMEEAKAFAHHLLCPRPLIYSIQKTGIRLTVDILGNLTGCYGTCLACMRRIPAVNVPPELNRKIRDNFMPYILNFFDFEIGETAADGSESADFGSYMDNYKE